MQININEFNGHILQRNLFTIVLVVENILGESVTYSTVRGVTVVRVAACVAAGDLRQ